MNRKITLAAMLLAACVAQAQQMLTLQQVKTLALQHNIRMKTADNAVQQARQQKQEALTNFFPQVSAVGMGFKTSTEAMKADVHLSDLLPPSLAAAIPPAIAGMLPSTIPFSMINKGVMAGVMAVQPVFAGGQIVNGNKLAQVGVAVSELQKQVSANAVTLQAEQYFWQIVALKEKQKTLEAVEEMLKKLEKDADAAVKAGVGMHNDLLKVQLKENEIESNKLKLTNGLKHAWCWRNISGPKATLMCAQPSTLQCFRPALCSRLTRHKRWLQHPNTSCCKSKLRPPSCNAAWKWASNCRRWPSVWATIITTCSAA